MSPVAGPPLELLLRRLIDTPLDFLDAPRARRGGQVATAALVADLIALHGGRATLRDLAPFMPGAETDSNRLILAAIATWWLSANELSQLQLERARLLVVLNEAVSELAGAAPAERYVAEPDRREEFARVLLDRLGLLPEGETLAQAQDRLSSVSSLERRRLLEASRAAEARARAIREALARKAASESADKWTRE